MLKRIRLSDGAFLPNANENPNGEISPNDVYPSLATISFRVQFLDDDEVTPVLLPAGGLAWDAKLPSLVRDCGTVLSIGAFSDPATGDANLYYTAYLSTPNYGPLGVFGSDGSTALQLSGQFRWNADDGTLGANLVRSQRYECFLDPSVETNDDDDAPLPPVQAIVTVNPASKALVNPSASDFYANNPPPSQGGAVSSVNGETGDVQLDANDVGALPVTFAGVVGQTDVGNNWLAVQHFPAGIDSGANGNWSIGADGNAKGQGIGADRGEAYAHFFANAGTGTEASPFTSTDGTAGTGGALASLPRGGCVTLAAGRFDVSTPPVINAPSIRVRGFSLGANIDPNGESEGISGTKIRYTGSTTGAITIAAPTNGSRLQGLSFENLYFWGTGRPGYGSPAAINITSAALDQPHFTDINVGNATAAIQVSPTPGTGSLDTPYFTRVNALNCAYGLIFAGSVLYAHVTSCCFSDIDWCGVQTGLSGGGGTFSDLTLVRCGRQGYQAAAIRVMSGNSRVLSCYISQTGINALGVHAANPADGISLESGLNLVSGNRLENTTNGSGIYLRYNASNNIIRDNKYSGNPVDITIDAGCADNVIDEPGQALSIVDNGTRTVINGISKNAGDPDTVGQWSGHAKFAGLHIRDTTNSVTYLYLTPTSRVTL